MFFLVLNQKVDAQCLNAEYPQWSPEGGWTVSGGSEGGHNITNWNLTATQAEQLNNSTPGFLINPDDFLNVELKFTMEVFTGEDDDFIGFTIGYEAPLGQVDNNNFQFKGYLIDWKSVTQGPASEGFYFSYSDEIYDYDNWDVGGSNLDKFVWRKENFNNTRVISRNNATQGWRENTEYQIRIRYTACGIQVWRDGESIIDEQLCNEIGKFGFYCYSQKRVRWKDFTYEHYFEFDVTEACVGEAVDFNYCQCPGWDFVSAGGTVTTDFGDGTSQIGFAQNHIYNSPGDYDITISVRDDNGCTWEGIQRVTIAGSEVDLGPDLLICPGEMVFIDAQIQGVQYLWSSGETSQTIDVSQEGEYRVQITDVNGCRSSDTVLVIMDACSKDYFNVDTLEICKGDSVLIEAFHLDGSVWAGDSIIPINDSTIWANPINDSWYHYGVAGQNYNRGSNIIVNGDFELGDVGFTSEYRSECGRQPHIMRGGYCVNDNPFDANNFFGNCGDHTTGNGNMMVVDGATIAGEEVWCQDIPVIPNRDYEFSAWVATVLANNPSILRFEINGSLIGNPLHADVNNCTWSNYAATWNSGLTNNAKICLVNQNTNGGGNDFALDDIEFMPINPIPNQTDSILVIVHENPIVNIGPDTLICEGDSVVFSTGNNFETYAWSTGESKYSITGNDSGEYRVTVTDSNGCIGSDTAMLTIVPKPILDLGTDVEFCLGDSIVLNAGNDGVQFLWNTGETTQEIVVHLSGTYSVELENANGCIGYDSVNIQVHELPNVDLGPDRYICPNSPNEIFEIGSFETYFWYEDASGIDSTFESNQAGAFAVAVMNDKGCSDSDTVALTIHPIPSVDLGPDRIICEGAANEIFDGGLFDNYQWFIQASGTNRLFETNQSGEFAIEVANSYGCLDSDTVVLTIIPLPNPDLLIDTAVCPGNDHTFEVSGYNDGFGPYSYLWSNGDTTEHITINTAGDFSVEITNSYGCVGKDEANLKIEGQLIVAINSAPILELCEGQDTVLRTNYTAVNGYNFTWTGPTTNSNLEEIITEANSGIYHVRVDNGFGCEGEAEIEVIVNLNPQPDPSDSSFCQGENIKIGLGMGANYSYLWSTGETTEEIEVNSNTISSPYSIKVTYTLTTCSSHAIITVTEIPNPEVNIEDITICEGDDVELKSTIVYNNASYQWSDGSNQEKINPLNGGDYVLTVTNDKGCQESDTAKVVIHPFPTVELGPDTVVICEGENHTFNAGNQIGDIEWNTGEITQTTTGDTTNRYTVAITEEGCVVRDTVDLIVNPIPESELDKKLADQSYCFEELERGLVLLGNENINYSYLWSTGETSNLISVNSPGNYSVDISFKGCLISDEITLREYCPPSIYFPNVFTPNGDGMNELFPTPSLRLQGYKFYIFNRWGELIFTSNSAHQFWDGTYKGNDCQIDVYVWKAVWQTLEESGKHQWNERVGKVSLIR